MMLHREQHEVSRGRSDWCEKTQRFCSSSCRVRCFLSCENSRVSTSWRRSLPVRLFTSAGGGHLIGCCTGMQSPLQQLRRVSVEEQVGCENYFMTPDHWSATTLCRRRGQHCPAKCLRDSKRHVPNTSERWIQFFRRLLVNEKTEDER